jgi:hypothetical protein
MMVKRLLNQEGPFRVVIGVVLFAAALLTFLIASLVSPEPFANKGDGAGDGKDSGKDNSKDNSKDSASLGDILSKINKISGTLLQPSTWTDRIDMYKMSPVDLARRYLKSQTKEEDAEE